MQLAISQARFSRATLRLQEVLSAKAWTPRRHHVGLTGRGAHRTHHRQACRLQDQHQECQRAQQRAAISCIDFRPDQTNPCTCCRMQMAHCLLLHSSPILCRAIPGWACPALPAHILHQAGSHQQCQQVNRWPSQPGSMPIWYPGTVKSFRESSIQLQSLGHKQSSQLQSC